MSPTTRSSSLTDQEKADHSVDGSAHDAAVPNAVVDDNGVVVLAKSRGVRDMELLNSRLNLKYRILLYGGFALLAYTMSQDQYTSSTYLATATSTAFGAHSLLSTITTVKAVFQSISQAPIAKISDVFGRVEAYCICVFLYALGYIVVASSKNIVTYAVGSSINVLGITGLFLLQNIIISDISSLRNRVIWTIFPSIPGLINVWVSGNITESMLKTGGWRWGYGIYCILVPVLSTPIILTLATGMRKRKAKDDAESPAVVDEAPHVQQSALAKTKSILIQLDVIGMLLLIGGAGMILITITLANSRTARWSDARSIALLVVGGLLAISFVLWERFGARHPIIPSSLLSSRTVIACMCIAVFQPATGGIAGGYFYTFLVVAGNQSVTSATRLNSLPQFTSGLSALIIGGFGARYLRRLKPIICVGLCIQILGLGLMIRFRGSTNSQGEIGMVQVVRGLGSGMVSFPVQAAIQSVSKHENMAAITAGELTVWYLAGGVGRSIGGSIWTNLVPGRISRYMQNETLAAAAYANPIGFAKEYLPGSAPRMAVARAHDEVQRILIIVALCFCVCGLISALCLENVVLTDDQTLKEVEERVDPKEAARLAAQAQAAKAPLQQ